MRILSANVNRSGAVHATVLQLAYEQGVDVLFVQEPWLHGEEARRLPKHHPAFNTLSPTQQWTDRPRVMTYARKDRLHLQVTADQSFPEHPDVMAVNVFGLRPAAVRLFNVYNGARGNTREGEAAARILQYGNLDQPEIYAGDFNMHHEFWSLTPPNGPCSSAAA